MAIGQTPAQQNPTVLIKEIKDQYVRTNFKNLSDYFSEQNQFLDFNFFEINASGAVDNQNLAHGLSTVPKDISVLFISGPGQITFDLDSSDATNLVYSTSGQVYARIFVGSYWGNQSSNPAPGKMVVGGQTASAENKVPTFTILKSGSGNYVPPIGVSYLRVRMAGAGGGGGGSFGSNATNGAAGGDTVFGTTLLRAGGGGGAGSVVDTDVGTGGAPSVTKPAVQIFAFKGGDGGDAGVTVMSTFTTPGEGGMTPFFAGGGAAVVGQAPDTAHPATPNSGGGGAGAGGNASLGQVGAGAGSGAYVEAIIPASSLEISYAYTIGKGGTGGTAAGGGYVGGTGADGIIIVEEFY